MPVSIDDGRGAAVTLRMVYEQPGVSLAVAGGGAVSITPIKPLPVDPIYRIAFTPSAALTAIGAATQARAFAIGAAAATQFMAAVVQARSSQMQAAAELQPVGGKTDSRLIQFTPSARMDPFIEGAQIEARDIRFTPSVDLAAVGASTVSRLGEIAAGSELQPVGAQVEARAVQTSSTAELQPVGGRIVLRSAAIAASVTTNFVGEAVAAATGLLDTYPGALGAWSLRNLSSSTTDVVRVRRSSDNAEADFTADDVVDGTLEAWVGAGNQGLVANLFDQSGNEYHAVQAAAGSQPRIVNSGALETINGKPTIRYILSQPTRLELPAAIYSFANTPNKTMFTVARYLGGSRCVYFGANWKNRVALRMNDEGLVQSALSGTSDGGTPVEYTETLGNLDLYYGYDLSGSQAAYFNGGFKGSNELGQGWNDVDRAYIGGYVDSNLNDWFDGQISEVILYPSDVTANETAIQQDIATYHGVTLT